MKHFHIQMAKLVEIFSKKNSNHPHEVWHTLKYAMHMAQCEALVYQSEQPQAGFHSKVRDCYHFGEKKWTTLHIDPWSQTAPRRRPPMMARSPPAAHESPLGMVDVTYHHRNHHRDVGGPVLSNFTLSTRLFLVAKKKQGSRANNPSMEVTCVIGGSGRQRQNHRASAVDGTVRGCFS